MHFHWWFAVVNCYNNKLCLTFKFYQRGTVCYWHMPSQFFLTKHHLSLPFLIWWLSSTVFSANESFSKLDGTLWTNLLQKITNLEESSVNPPCAFRHGPFPFSFARSGWLTVMQEHHCSGTFQENFAKIFEWQNDLKKIIVSNWSIPHTHTPYFLLPFEVFPTFLQVTVWQSCRYLFQLHSRFFQRWRSTGKSGD